MRPERSTIARVAPASRRARADGTARRAKQPSRRWPRSFLAGFLLVVVVGAMGASALLGATPSAAPIATILQDRATQLPPFVPTGIHLGLSVSVSSSPRSGAVPLLVNFTASTSGGVLPLAYSWTFGDGGSSTTRDPSHTYRTSGNFTATVTATDLLLSTANASLMVRVGPSGTLFAANATASPTTGAAPLLVDFAGSASHGSPPYSYAWQFGDGGISSQQDPSHQYTSPGSYSAVLTVTDHYGRNATDSIGISASLSGTGTAGTLLAGSVLGVAPSTFLSIDLQTSNRNAVSTSAPVKGFLAAATFGSYRYGAGSDACNMTTNVQYGSDGAPSGGCWFNVSAFKQFCYATTPHCNSILDLPGENNNSPEDASIAKWVVSTVGFQPTYWSIGNEPTGWTHYGIPWTKWSATDAQSATPVAYAFDVKAAIAAIRSVDPAAKFVGIEAACSCNTAWFQDVARVDGPSLAAIAYHSYPSPNGATTVTPAQFLAPLSSASNLTASYAAVRADILGDCATCATMPLLVNEYNAGPGWSPSNFDGTYVDAVFLAASVVQGLRANVTELTVFNLQTSGSSTSGGYSLLNGVGTAGPTGLLYSEVLSHLPIGTVVGSVVRTTIPSVWSVVTRTSSEEALLVVNANLTRSLSLSLGTAFPTGVSGTVIRWSSTMSSPSTTSATLATSYSVGPEAILLLTVPLVHGVPAAPVGHPTVAPGPAAPIGETAAAVRTGV